MCKREIEKEAFGRSKRFPGSLFCMNDMNDRKSTSYYTKTLREGTKHQYV